MKDESNKGQVSLVMKISSANFELPRPMHHIRHALTFCFVIGFCVFSAVAQTLPPNAGEGSAGGSNAMQRAPTAKPSCADKLENFIAELDGILTTPSTIDLAYDLFRKYFPLESCDIQKSIEMCRRSKFFEKTFETQTSHVCKFGRAKTFRALGAEVSFGLKKDSGDSVMPFAITRK